MKSITPDNYIVRPFLTHKTQEVPYTFLAGSNSSLISIDVATITPAVRPWIWYTENEQVNADGLYARPLHASILHMFYGTAATYSVSSSVALKFDPTDHDVYIVNIAQQAFGETVRASSFRFTAPSSVTELYDDGKGRIVSTTDPTRVVGNIFYGVGIAVIKASTGSYTGSIVSVDGLYLDTGSAVEVTFDASHTIYEHQVVCTMEPGDFNYSMNPSIRRDGSPAILNQFASGTLPPYMTTVGLYTDLGELVGLGKFPRPIKRAVNSQQSIIVRFDI